MPLYYMKTYYKPQDSDKYEIHFFKTPSNLGRLKNLIENTYPALLGKSYRLSVIDDDGDEICMETHEDFETFFGRFHGSTLILNKEFKIYVEEVKKDRGAGYNRATHEGVVCDECNSQIEGFRYKCLECCDYDLCEKCEGLHHHSNHLMVRLGTPRPCSVVLKRARDNCRSFLLCVGESSGDEGHCDCRRRKGKDKHRRHSGRSSEKRENDGEGGDRKCMKRFKRANYLDYMDMFNNFIRKYDKFINPSLTTHEDIGEREASFITNCSEILADLTTAYCNSIFDRNGGVPCRGNSSAETANEKEGNKSDSEESVGASKSENEGAPKSEREAAAPKSESEGASKSESEGASKSESEGASKSESEGASKSESEGASKSESVGASKSEREAAAPKSENGGAKATGSVFTNLEDLLKRFSSQAITDEKEPVAVASEETPREAGAHSQPKLDKQNSSEKKVGSYKGHELSSNVMLSLLEMFSMGFSSDDERIIPLLVEYDGDISKVIDALYKN